MKNIIIFVLIIRICSPLFAQGPSIQWQTCLGGTQGEDARAIIQLPDSGYIFAGTTFSNNGNVSGNHGSYDIWVARLNKNGSMLWQKCYGGTNQDHGRSIQSTHDGGFILAGQSMSVNGNVSGNHGISDYWVVKLNSSGVIQWQKSLGGTATENVTAIKQTSDHGYIVGGTSSSNNGDVSGNHGNTDFWIVKIDSVGIIQWQKSLGGSNGDALTALFQTTDGGYIACGSTASSDGDVSFNHGGGDCWIVKLNNMGNLQWEKSYGGSTVESGESIEQTSDGGFIFSGYTLSNDGDVSGNNGIYDYWMVRLDTLGNIQWQKSLGGSANDYSYSVHQTNDGGFVATGKINSYDGFVTLNHGQWDNWVVKTDNNGVVQWQQSYGGSNLEAAFSIIQTMDDGFMVAGFTWSNDGDVTGWHGNQDVWLFKLTGFNTLPVDLTSFTASAVSGNHVICEWTTLSENNNDFFSVERCSDGSHYHTIGIIHGTNFSNSSKNYSLDDLSPQPGISYYRLSQTDLNGYQTFLKTVAVELKKINHITVQYSGNAGLSIRSHLPISEIKLFDVNGKLVRDYYYSEAMESLFMDVADLRKGMYFIRFISGEEYYFQKILIE